MPQSKAKRDLCYENILEKNFMVQATNFAWVTNTILIGPIFTNRCPS